MICRNPKFQSRQENGCLRADEKLVHLLVPSEEPGGIRLIEGSQPNERAGNVDGDCGRYGQRIALYWRSGCKNGSSASY